MKKYWTFIFLLIAGNSLLAQGVRVNLYGSYVFDDYFEAYADSYNYYHGTIEGGFQWGAGIEYSLRPTYSVELLYLRQDTHAPTTWQSGQFVAVTTDDLTLDINYMMLAGNRHVHSQNGKLESYGGLMAGVGTLNVTNESTNNSSSLTKFAWGIRLGCNIWATETVAIKVQAQLVSAVQAAGGGAYIGTGGGGVSVNSYSTIYQFSLGGGLSYKLGKRNQPAEKAN
ncbi:porin family protein [Fulvivirgaceae bacterium PWU4]|uniref:Porin family protein n=1 Tax=Chryseosolibacter histidini TaxID=2782349 RepID=A0AAP2DNG5_9BACT|nr:porin family protein [Chryseosolibacter histidini]MBT1699536.1 porin family protein [Chryseosolibacter histidini]